MQINETYQKIKQDLEKYYSSKDNNRWRNKFHIEMPFGLVNDPNGLAYYTMNIIYFINGIHLDVNIKLNTGD